ncbi:MAG: hypothetical protein HY593_00245 [Candidatus Omnitrophica bacterium]|nr:hypothetical protein [Elusimicrobiota bacterium]MBI4352331.1 hypothetical protein [Candidatus Omnitrophota bacterium]
MTTVGVGLMFDYEMHITLHNGTLKKTTYRHLVEVLTIWDEGLGCELFAIPTVFQAHHLAGLLKDHFPHIQMVQIFDGEGREV